jgi:hypothetical protein
MSAHFLEAAWHLARAAKDIEAEKIDDAEKGKVSRNFEIEHRGYVISSIFMSIAFVEAVINELLSDSSEGQTSSFHGLTQRAADLLGKMRPSKNARLPKSLAKYQNALAHAGKAAFDPKTSPFHEVCDVITLRNALVHYEPETIESDATKDPNELHDWEQRLRNKFDENPLVTAGSVFFPDKCLSFGCAAWAYDVCGQLADEFCSRLQIQAPYSHQKARLPPLTKNVS